MSTPSSEMLQRGGQDGLAQLMELERYHLRAFLERRIHRRLASRLDASDVIQEVYVRARQALPNYLASPNIPPLIWLRHLCVQVLSEVHRKHFRSVRNPFREAQPFENVLITSLVNSSISTEIKFERLDVANKIQSALKEMNSIDQEVLEMRHVDGYSLAEISKMLELNYETVKKRYYRALNRFKELADEQSLID